MHRPKHVLEYVALRLLVGLLGLLPLRLALVCAWGLAFVVHFVFRFRVAAARSRLVEVFGKSMSAREVRRVAWLSWRNLCFNAVEIVRLRRFTLEDVNRCYVNPEAIDQVSTKVAPELGRLLAVPHAGNWDMAGLAVQLHGFPLFVLARPQSNPLTDQFLNQMRGAQGVPAVMNDSRMLRDIVRRLKSGEWMAILPDVRARQPAVVVDYLGGRANIGGGVAMFARMAKVPIQPAFCVRVGWTRHRFIVGEPIWADATANKDDDARRVTQELMAFFEHHVRQHPEQYFWYNKRWVLDPIPQ